MTSRDQSTIDQIASAALEKMQARVYAALRVRHIPPADAQDALQDTLLYAWRNRHSLTEQLTDLEEHLPLFIWLALQHHQRAALSEQRRKNRQTRATAGRLFTDDDPADTVIRSDLFADHPEWAALPDRQRYILWRKSQGRTSKEIAAEMGISVRAVNKFLAKLRDQP